jgi:hypothetical protein
VQPSSGPGELFVVVLMAVFLQICLILLSFTGTKSAGMINWVYIPSVLVAWAGYAYYEKVYIPNNCPGDCAIRTDLVFIYPYLAFVTIAAIAYALRTEPHRSRRS